MTGVTRATRARSVIRGLQGLRDLPVPWDLKAQPVRKDLSALLDKLDKL
jgi:hypothetical protein